jgi:hypothetical protein
VVAVIEVVLTTLIPVTAVPPTVTVAPPIKFAPVMVILIPPAVVPELGEILTTVGPGNDKPPPPDGAGVK